MTRSPTNHCRLKRDIAPQTTSLSPLSDPGSGIHRIIAYDTDLTPYAILVVTAADGTYSLKTEDGREVRRIARGEYDIVGSGAMISVLSDDPAGP
jgi:hypothetical protein